MLFYTTQIYIYQLWHVRTQKALLVTSLVRIKAQAGARASGVLG